MLPSSLRSLHISPEAQDALRRYAPQAVGGGVLVLVGWCIGKFIKTLIDSTKPLPFPGPKGVPFFGMALELDEEKALACMRVWNKQYGKTIAFRVFGTPYVVTQKNDTIRTLMKDRAKGFYVRHFNYLRFLPKSGMFLTEGDQWKANRKAAEPALVESVADKMVPVMSQMSKRMVNCISTLADPSGSIIEWVPHKWFRRCTLDFTLATHYGKDYNLQNPLDMRKAEERDIAYNAVQGFLDAIDYVFKHTPLAPFIQDRYPFKFNPSVAKFYKSIKNVESYSAKIIDDREKELSAGAEPREDVLDKLIKMHKGDLTWNLVSFVLAGSASASATMEWFIYLMCVNREAQDVARKEIDALGKDVTTADDLKKLPYVEACMLEVLRVQSSTPGPLPSVVVAPYSIEGKPVEPGTIVIMMMDEAMRSEERGGETFRPENWFLPGTREINRDLYRDHWAFSTGPRKCPGQAVAVRECVVMAATLLRHFDNMHFTIGYDDVKETMWLNRVPANLKVDMKVREF
ncbi:hypothetical protein FOL47_004581 [Perkinsus chesapeaki]|uniref:Cytochrome P450 n=1 Tax=Perkinsus chesapeaki TaxID=330153 RepID=A0A7J6MZ21_PERCH|nr:hypothetical protein FOL47_004581 [Perkinsus chesapeaki]